MMRFSRQGQSTLAAVLLPLFVAPGFLAAAIPNTAVVTAGNAPGVSTAMCVSAVDTVGSALLSNLVSVSSANADAVTAYECVDLVCPVAAGSLGFVNRGYASATNVASATFGQRACANVLASDFGDAPASYGTAAASAGPYHFVGPALRIGAATDVDADGVPTSGADGDGADEDGVAFSVPIDGNANTNSVQAVVTGSNTTGSPAMLCGYLDGGGTGLVDGAFTSSVTYSPGLVGLDDPVVGAGNEEVCIQIPVAGTTSVVLGGGSNPASASCDGGATFMCTLRWQADYPASTTAYARFRLTTDPTFFSPGGPSPLGEAADGEVEDHRLDLNPTRATVTDFDAKLVSVQELRNTPAFASLVDGLAGSRLVTLVQWQTAAEQGTSGFDLEREFPEGGWEKLNTDVLPGLMVSRQGGQYVWLDLSGDSGERSYRLAEHEVWGSTLHHGPWKVTLEDPKGLSKRSEASSVAPLPSEQSSHQLEWWAWTQRGNERFASRGRSPRPPATGRVTQRADAQRSARAELLRDRLADSPSLIEYSSDGGSGSSQSSASRSRGRAALGARFRTEKPGLYAASLAGVSQALNLTETEALELMKRRQLALSMGGEPIPYSFDGETIEFVGYPYSGLDTDQNVYQLRLGSATHIERGRNNRPRGVSKPLAGVAQDQFVDTTTAENDVWLLPWANREEGSDPWYWGFTYAPSQPSATFDVQLATPARTGSLSLDVHVRGASNVGPGSDHTIWFEVNGNRISRDFTWDGFGIQRFGARFDQSLLDGLDSFELTVNSLATGGADYSFVLVDKVEVEYARRLEAKEGSLWLDGVGGLIGVGGFESDDLKVLELSSDRSVVERTDFSVSVDGLGGWQANFFANPQREYLVASRRLAPVIETDVPVGLSRRLQAEYLIIAPESLAVGAETLARFRSRRFHTEIVWLQDIYDEFSHGRTDSAAIQAFLRQQARYPATRPEYVVLLGRGTHDHRDRLGYGESLIPLRLASTPFGLYSSDIRYADVDGDHRPEYALGRIPAVTVDEVLAYVQKLADFEEGRGRGRGVAAVVADNPDTAGNFHENGEQVVDALSTYGYSSVPLFHPDQAVHDDLLTGWEGGQWSLIAYSGHGAPTQLGSENFLDTEDAAVFTENAGTPIFTAWTCAAGDSTAPGLLGLSDTLVLSEQGGALASVSPAGLSLDAPAHLLSLEFLRSLVAASSSIGRAYVDAHSAGEELGVPDWMLDIYLVSGDPAVVLPK